MGEVECNALTGWGAAITPERCHKDSGITLTGWEGSAPDTRQAQVSVRSG